MKRILVMLLVLSLAISFFACSRVIKKDIDSDVFSKIDTNTEENIESTDSNILPMSNLRPISKFREGLIFVKRKSDMRICCINKKGEIQFELSSMEGSYYVPNDAMDNGFYNGLAIVNLYDDDLRIVDEYLCKTDGTIVKPEDFGCDDFLLTPSSKSGENERLLSDGYILASKGNKMGVLNNKFEWITPLNEELYIAVQGYISENTDEGVSSFYYGQEMFLSPKGYVNIITGEKGKIDEIEVSLKKPSDFWVFSSGEGSVTFKNELYDHRVNALDLSDFYGDYIKGLGFSERDDILPAFGFEDGVADVLVYVDGQQIFSLVNEQGEQILPSTQVKGDKCCYDNVTKTYCVYGQDKIGNFVIEIFNTSGKISEYNYSVPDYAEYVGASLEDGVIMVCVRYEKNGKKEYDWEFFDSNFELLY